MVEEEKPASANLSVCVRGAKGICPFLAMTRAWLHIQPRPVEGTRGEFHAAGLEAQDISSPTGCVMMRETSVLLVEQNHELGIQKSWFPWRKHRATATLNDLVAREVNKQELRRWLP